MIKYKLVSFIKIALPTLSVQITQACNYSCIHCDFQKSIRMTMNQRPLHMSLELFHKIVEQYQAYAPNTLRHVSLSAGGEPMMHPSFNEICRYLDRAGISFGFDTNASKLDFPTATGLLSLPHFKRIVFSVDGFSADVYEAIRRGGNFENVIENIRNFLALAGYYDRKDITTRINMVLQSKNVHEVENMISYWTPQVSQVNISVLRKGTRFISPNWLPAERKSCDFLRNYMRILTDGTVIVCCIDDQFVSFIGNFNESSLEDIWNGPEYQKLRAAHDSGDYGYFPVCSDCDAWAGFYPAREFRQFSDTITVGVRPANIIAFK
ncbi:MAG: radical SAM/SPASM domain-containing protein, partial [Candidatus Margulisbacteria bacterium]|nr:radical SAM/SPASM domain-containing protein [Candidatus Margulisiibacteriota bacterium]